MKIVATGAAAEAVRRVRASGRSDLVMVLGSGCCDSTSPFLFDHHIPEPGSIRVGEIDGVEVLAPAWLEKLYAGDELVVDAIEGLEDSMSLETEFDRRFVVRAPVVEHRH